jgi:hypothetical protein
LDPVSCYPGQFLFTEGDDAYEMYFVIIGHFVLIHDFSSSLVLPKDAINPETESFNIPFIQYNDNAYFGDNDCLIKDAKGRLSSKAFRQSTCLTTTEGNQTDVMTLHKKSLMEILEDFPKMKKYMFDVAREKKIYHEALFESINMRYNSSPREMSSMVKWRMDEINEEETTFMSFKRQLRKKKEQS